MKRLVAVAALALQAALLCAEPVVGRSMGRELRMRDAPAAAGKLVGTLSSDEEALVIGRSAEMAVIDGMKAYWLRVVGVRGVEGWVYGGYLDADAGKVEEYSADDVSVEVVDLSDAFGEGAAARVTLSDARHHGARVEALFVRTAKAGAKAVYAEGTGERDFAYLDFKDLEFIDLVGDPGREICAGFEEGGGDYSVAFLRVYGFLAEKRRYVLLGIIDRGSFSGGAGYGIGSGSSVEKGPYALAAGGKKYAVIRLRTGSTDLISGEEGGDYLLTTVSLVELRYELRGDALALAGETVIDRSESRKPFGGGGE